MSNESIGSKELSSFQRGKTSCRGIPAVRDPFDGSAAAVSLGEPELSAGLLRQTRGAFRRILRRRIVSCVSQAQTPPGQA
jgi:hypothetical protein